MRGAKGPSETPAREMAGKGLRWAEPTYKRSYMRGAKGQSETPARTAVEKEAVVGGGHPT